MGRGEKNFIFEKENSDIDSIVLQFVGVNFNFKRTPMSLTHMALLLPFFLLFTPHGPMKVQKEKPKASRATGLSSTEGLY